MGFLIFCRLEGVWENCLGEIIGYFFWERKDVLGGRILEYGIKNYGKLWIRELFLWVELVLIKEDFFSLDIGFDMRLVGF